MDSGVPNIWILTDSKSSIQYLKKWPSILENLGQEIVIKLTTFSKIGSVHLQWIPTQVGIYRNEIADRLAKEGSELATPPSSKLLVTEVHSLKLARVNSAWMHPPDHDWYAAKCPRLSLQNTCPRLAQTALSRLRTCHIKCLTFRAKEKTYVYCHCSPIASPSHLLD
nr:uncharacterized protein LOC107450976 [Parasteatoda tepidariorum]